MELNVGTKKFQNLCIDRHFNRVYSDATKCDIYTQVFHNMHCHELWRSIIHHHMNGLGAFKLQEFLNFVLGA